MKEPAKAQIIAALFVASLILMLLLAGCRTKTVYIPVESVRTEYRDKYMRDSILYYDSVYIREKGDSVVLEKYKYIYRDRLKTDTIVKRDSIAMPYPVVETREVKTYPAWLVVLACMGGGFAGFIIFKIVNLFK